MPPEAPRKDAAVEDGELATLVALVGATSVPGPGSLRALVETLAHLTDAGYALVAELAGDRMRPLAFRTPHGIEELDRFPTAAALGETWPGELVHHARGAAERFPDDALLRARGIEGFLAQHLRAPDGSVIGVLALFDTGPMPEDARRTALFRLCAARATGELVRANLQRTLGESEERFRDLFDEAPIAYVHEELDTRFLRANRAAQRAFGIRADEVVGTYGRSLVVDNPDNQRRLKEAFASVGRGTETSGVVLELRRKDNGKPLWIQWWSKPDPSGAYTRTMFIDITERVLMEQEQARLKEQNRYLREEIESVHNFEEIVGRSPGLVEVLEKVERVAKTDSTVLITGETGTGKELIARAIHSSSKRRDKPLIKLNCAALPTGLVESELFGHEKGAFSGALARRLGRFELAQGGTIFLDEIGEVPPDVQVKLLRVLQEREFERVGGNTTIQVDVRLIAATNRDLARAVAEGRFREDLYYRLDVFPLHLPALRERADDVPLLVRFFLQKFNARVGRSIGDVDPLLMERLCAYHWPGNVRELENLVERAVILANGSTLDVASAPLPGPRPGVATADAPSPAAASLETVERDHIRATLDRTDWVIEGPAGAAKLLELHPNTLRSRMKKLGIERTPRRAGGAPRSTPHPTP